MLRRLLVAAPAILATGCSCNQDYAFPDPLFVAPDAPESFGSWLSMDAAPDGIRLVISYYDTVDGALGFAVGTPTADGTVEWEHEQVDGYAGDDGLDRGDRGKYSSLKVAGDGSVWLERFEPVTGPDGVERVEWWVVGPDGSPRGRVFTPTGFAVHVIGADLRDPPDAGELEERAESPLEGEPVPLRDVWALVALIGRDEGFDGQAVLGQVEGLQIVSGAT